MLDLPPPPAVPVDASPAVIERLEEKTPLTFECLRRVSSRYSVHPVILSLVARVEGGWTGARIENTNGTFDLGLMQINTIHLSYLGEGGITEAMLQNNDCINTGFAAYYIRKVTIGQTSVGSEDYFRAIARYHSKNEPHLSRYANRLLEEWEKAKSEMQGRGK
ncbi:lytic transglycosylase domain-containing protein [Marinobacter salarius]|uniref:Transglycosylase SLT domain protein n=1 Tax=Marinobacter salarius TaxID=1420917 RepID=A0A1W6KFP7_9GAMM|nr:lytic transglycosylase domain-containing protein [Marinobacter salarius]ARM86223.1 transglycosylase SLT domain protein [Marinobacter salarius]